jgi:predicted metal-binding protein
MATTHNLLKLHQHFTATEDGPQPSRQRPLKISPVAYAEEPPGGRRRTSDSRGPLTA